MKSSPDVLKAAFNILLRYETDTALRDYLVEWFGQPGPPLPAGELSSYADPYELEVLGFADVSLLTMSDMPNILRRCEELLFGKETKENL